MSISYLDVPGFFDFEDIYEDAVRSAVDGDVLVEVGALFGRSTIYMAEQIKKSRKHLDFYVVDLWRVWPDVIFNEGTYYANTVKEHGSLFGAFAHFVEASGVSEYIKVIRMDSAEAAEIVPNAFFVFIDAAHTYESVKRDIEAWRVNMLRKPWVTTQMLAGHDYDKEVWPGVVQAVDEMFPGQVIVRNKSWLVRL